MTQGLPLTYQEPKWTDDLDPAGRETQSDLESLEQDVLHIISERLASNLADPQKGAGAADMLSGDATVFAALPHVIDAQLALVSRITASHTTQTTAADGSPILNVQVSVAGAVVNFQYIVTPQGVSKASP